MKNKTFFNVITTVMLAGLLVLTACPDPGGDDGKKESPSVYSYRLGDIAEEVGFDFPAEGISLDDLMQMTNGMTYQEMLDAGNIPRLYKDPALTQPFSGSDILNADTMIYCERDLFGNDGDGGDGGDPGEVIGRITGTITLTDVSSPAPKVEIRVEGNNGAWESFYNKINISGSDTLSDISWSIDIHEHSGFSPSYGTFNLWVTPAGSEQGFYVEIPDAKYIDTVNSDVGNLGTVSIKTITLSGTINVTCNGQAVPGVRITALDYDSRNDLGSTKLESPANGAIWSITLPALSSPVTNVHFRVEGFMGGEETYKQLFYRDLEDPITVNNSNKENIFLNVGNIVIVTLSGTINVTCNNKPVPKITIYVYAVSYDNEEQQFGFVELEHTSSGTPWSITMPELSSSVEVKFRVRGFTANWQDIFSRELPNSTVTVSNSSPPEIKGITLDVGNITTVILSGTINITCNNQLVSNVEIIAFDNETNNMIGSTSIESPSANAPWSIILPESNSSNQVRFRVSGDLNGWSFDKEIPDVYTNLSGISLNVSVNSITVSGTINVTCNNSPVSYVVIYACYDNSDPYQCSVSLESPGPNAEWSMTLPAFSSPTQIYFRVSGSSKNGGNFSKNLTSLTKTVYDTNVSGININVGNIRLITMSGTVNFTNNGEPVSNISIGAYDNTGKELAFNNAYIESPVSGAQWSITLNELDSLTSVKFKVTGYSMNVGMSFYREISGPTLSADDADKSGISLDLGNITPVTLSGTINVNYNGQPVPNVRIEARTENPGSFSSTELNSPASGAPWSISIPSFSSSTQVSFTVNCSSENDYYLFIDVPTPVTVSGSNVSGITLDLGDITSP